MNDAVRAAVERLVPHRGGMLWLERIVACDGEGAVAEAVVRDDHPFLEGAGIPEGAEDAYYTPQVSDLTAPVYEHAARTIDRSLRAGAVHAGSALAN